MNNMLNVDNFKLAELVFCWKFWFDDSKRKEMKIYFKKRNEDIFLSNDTLFN